MPELLQLSACDFNAHINTRLPVTTITCHVQMCFYVTRGHVEKFC
jgi:hypothetical protein